MVKFFWIIGILSWIVSVKVHFDSKTVLQESTSTELFIAAAIFMTGGQIVAEIRKIKNKETKFEMEEPDLNSDVGAA